MPPGRCIVHDELIPACSPCAGQMESGQFLRIIDLKGRQAVDLLCHYSADDKEERYNVPNTLKAAGTLSLTSGHILYSDLANPMFEIVSETYGGHATIADCCSAASTPIP